MHAHQFWWTWLFRFQRYGYLSKTAKFPLRGMDYSPWSSKILFNWNRLKNSCKYRSMYCACTPILMALHFQRNLLIFVCLLNNQKFFSDQSLFLHNVNFNNNNAISVIMYSFLVYSSLYIETRSTFILFFHFLCINYIWTLKL